MWEILDPLASIWEGTNIGEFLSQHNYLLWLALAGAVGYGILMAKYAIKHRRARRAKREAEEEDAKRKSKKELGSKRKKK